MITRALTWLLRQLRPPRQRPPLGLGLIATAEQDTPLRRTCTVKVFIRSGTLRGSESEPPCIELAMPKIGARACPKPLP